MSANTGQSKSVFRIRESEWTQLTLPDEDLRLLLSVKGEWDQSAFGQSMEQQVKTSNVIGLRQSNFGTVEIRVNEAIGAIELQSMVVIVEPKIPMDHFNFIACRALRQNVKIRLDRSSLEAGTNFIELVANWALSEITSIVMSGLHRDYKTIESEGALSRGRLLPAQTSLNLLRGKVKVRFEADDHVLDNPLNRVFRAALIFIYRNPTLNQNLRRAARTLSRRFLEVGPLQQTDLNYRAERHTMRFLDAFEFSKVLLSSAGLNLNGGRSQSRSFLIKTPYLIEEGLRNILRAGLPTMGVHKPAPKNLDANFSISANPDLGFTAGDLLTGDIKYKTADPLLKRSDLMQASFFALAFEAPRGLIIDFQISPAAFFEQVKVSNIVISRIPWNVSLGLPPEKTESIFVNDVKTWLISSDPSTSSKELPFLAKTLNPPQTGFPQPTILRAQTRR